MSVHNVRNIFNFTKSQAPNSKPQVSSSKSVLNLGLGIWNLELYSIKMLNSTDTKQLGSSLLEFGAWNLGLGAL